MKTVKLLCSVALGGPVRDARGELTGETTERLAEPGEVVELDDDLAAELVARGAAAEHGERQGAAS